MKARMRQLAVIEVLGIERNSTEHKMLDGRLPIPDLTLDQPIGSEDNPVTAPKESAEIYPTSVLQETDVRRSSDNQPFFTRPAVIILVAICLTIFFWFFAPSVVFYQAEGARVTGDQLNEETQALAHPSCANLDTAKSLSSVIPVEIFIKNNSEAPVFGAWVDFEGVVRERSQIAPGASYSGVSFDSHPFLFSREDGSCIRLVTVQEGVQNYDLFDVAQ